MRNLKARIERVEPLHEQVYQILRRAIVEGQFKPGQTLSESELAKMIGVSRTPVRESVRRLIQEGLISPAPGGLVVYAPSVADVAEVYVARSSIEGIAAALAATNPHRDAHLQRMDEILKKAETALDKQSASAFSRYNTEFHDALVKSAENDRLAQLLESLRSYVVQYRNSSLQVAEHRAASVAEHRSILEVLAEGRAELAQQLVQRHILRAGFRVVQWLGGLPETNPTYGLLARAALEREDT